MKTSLYVSAFIFSSVTAIAKNNPELLFAQNQRQWQNDIAYKAYLPGGAVFLTKNSFMYSYYDVKDLQHIHDLKHGKANVDTATVHFHAYEAAFTGSNEHVRLIAGQKQSFHYNYFIGNDPSKWASDVPVFKTVTYENLYDGIDARIYSTGTSMKYDFIVAPGADAGQIGLKFTGITPKILRNGDLEIKTSVNTILEKAPYCYQLINGNKKQVACRYTLGKDGILRFGFPAGYDHVRELVIDPVLIFATFSGSTVNTYGFSATYDTSGCLYAGGEVFGVGWPTTTGAFQTTYGGGVDAGINKYTSDGSGLIYSTYYGGSSSDLPNNMIVTPNNELVIAGSTASSNLATTTGCYDATFNGGNSDLYVARFNASGSGLVGATYIGGNDEDGTNTFSLSPNYGDAHRGDVLIDTAGNIIVCSSSSSANFPSTSGAFQAVIGGAQDGVVFKMDSSCSNLLFSTFLGGSGEDACFSLAKTSAEQLVVTGGTSSSNFPTVTGAVLPAYQGATDGFVAILDPSGNNLIHSTYLGTNGYDHAFRVQVNPLNDHVFVCGQTSGNYVPSPGVYSNPGGNIFIQELSADLSTAILDTRIGDVNSTLVPTAFLYDNCGNIYFCGFNAMANLPLTPDAQQTAPGGFWLCVLEPGMASLLYGSYMGGLGDHVDGGSSRFDPQGIVYHSVCTYSGFTTTPSSWCPVKLSSGFDVASFKFDFEATGVIAGIGVAGKDSVCAPGAIQFINTSSAATSYVWDFGDNTPTSTTATPSHTYTTPGTYQVTLYAHRPTGCITDDTAYYTVYALHLDPPMLTVRDTIVCQPGIVTLSANMLNNNSSRSFHWTPVNAITSSPDQQTITADVTLSTVFTVTVTDSISDVCKEMTQGTIHITLRDVNAFQAFGDTTICRGDTVSLWATGGDHYVWSPDYYINDTHVATVQVSPQESTTYSVVISDDAGCEKTRTVNVSLHPDIHLDAGEDFYIKYGEISSLHATGADQYLWSPAYRIDPLNVPDPNVAPEITTTYFVLGTSKEGCKAIDSVTVKVTNVIIPNAFSPNGDGLNDRFYVRPAHGGVTELNFSIFNRWGERVFHTNQPSEGWDGRYKGEPAEMGTYFYRATYTIGKRQYSEKGDLALVR